MTDMIARLSNLTPITQITWLESEAGRELTRPVVLACNGVAEIDSFLDNVGGLGADGTIDVSKVAMPWDFELTYAEDTTPIAEIYRFSWTSPLDTVTMQPMMQLRKMQRTVAAGLIVSLEHYVLSDVIMLQRMKPYLSLSGRPGGTRLAIPTFNLNIVLHEVTVAATS